jgi:hypothetical protein
VNKGRQYEKEKVANSPRHVHFLLVLSLKKRRNDDGTEADEDIKINYLKLEKSLEEL